MAIPVPPTTSIQEKNPIKYSWDTDSSISAQFGTLCTGNYLGAQSADKGVRFQRNVCLGEWKIGNPT